MHITSLFLYTFQLEALLNLVFLLFLHSQSYPDVAKAWTHYYMNTLYISQAVFLSTWSQLLSHFFVLLLPKKIFCITPWQ